MWRGLAALSAMLWAATAGAIGEVSSPNVTKDQLSVEYGFARTFDDEHSKDGQFSHELELKYGVAPRLRYEAKLEVEDGHGRETQVDGFEVGAQYQLASRGANWLDSAVKLSYAHRPNAPEAIKAKLLLEKKHGRFTHRSNISLSQDVGHGAATGGPEWKSQWSSRYRVVDGLALGVELENELGQWRTFDERDAQRHYAGPSVYGSISDAWSYEAAYFFGLNDEAADGAALVILEYSTKF